VNDDQATLVEEITKQLTDEGRIIEAGWQAMRIFALPPNASSVQLSEMRKAFFAGAQHLFASIIATVDDGDQEPTVDDLRRMDLIHQELGRFADWLRSQIGADG
jgi:hypothetical protein